MSLQASVTYSLLLLSVYLPPFLSAQGELMGEPDYPRAELISGDIKNIYNVRNFGFEFDYRSTSIDRFRTEEEFFDHKKKTNPYGFEQFREAWYSSRTKDFEPKFAELFCKYGDKCGVAGRNYSKDAPVRVVVKTLVTSLGFHAGVVSKPSYIDVECAFIDADGNEICRYGIYNSYGSSAMGYDFSVSQRLVESYARAGKMLAKQICEDIRIYSRLVEKEKRKTLKN